VGWWRWWRTTGSRTPRDPVALLADEEEKREWRKEERRGTGPEGVRRAGPPELGWAGRAKEERGPKGKSQGYRVRVFLFWFFSFSVFV
jgi:hypothetical protein